MNKYLAYYGIVFGAVVLGGVWWTWVDGKTSYWIAAGAILGTLVWIDTMLESIEKCSEKARIKKQHAQTIRLLDPYPTMFTILTITHPESPGPQPLTRRRLPARLHNGTPRQVSSHIVPG